MDRDVNMNDPKLQAILGRSKAVMGKAEGRKKNSGGGLNEGQIPQQYEEREPPMPQMNLRRDEPIDPNSPEYKARLQSSKLPDEIKRAMMDNPDPGGEPMFEPPKQLYSAADLGYGQPQAQQPAPTPQPMRENRAPAQPQQPIINREEIKSIVKEVLAEMMVKTISENSIKKTLRTLMSEGKIKPKK